MAGNIIGFILWMLGSIIFFIIGAVIMALLGLPLLAGQNSPLIMISAIGMLWLCFGVCIAYVKVEKKYRTK